MAGFAALLVGLGIIGLIYGLIMRSRAGRVTDAPFVKTGEIAQKGTAVANPKGGISAEGNVSCPQPLTSPVSGTMCLYYELTVTAQWKDGDTTKTKELTKEKRAAQFAIDDGTGPVWVDAREGGDFEPQQTKSETKGTGLLGGITGQDLMFGNYRVSTGMLSLGTKYTVEEKVLPAVPRIYACGKVGSSNEITKPGWRALLLTNKSREDYLAHALKSAKIALIAGGSMIGVGIILGVVSSFVGGDDAKKTAATASATATASAPATATATATDTAAANTAAPRPLPGGAKTPPPPTKATATTTAAATSTPAPPPAKTAAPATKPGTKKK
jgi:hypothetical protein